MNTITKQARKTQTGFTLVEFMIAISLGVVLVTGLITAFIGSKRTSELNSTLAELQETGRFALDSMIRDLRMAGFQGCANISTLPATVRADAAPTEDYIRDSLQVFEVQSATNWNPSPHNSFSIPSDVGVPIPGTHAVSIQFGSPTTFNIETMKDTLSPIVITNDNSDLIRGDLAIVSDCSGADIFEISDETGGVLLHGKDVNGGDARLSAPYGQGTFHNLPRVMRFEANIYYVGDTGRVNAQNEPIRALYRQTLPYTTPPMEMAEGVENLRFRVGVEDPEVEGDITFVTPNHSLLDTHRVRSVQVGFLMQSYSSIASKPDTRTYQIAGYNIPSGAAKVADGETHASDTKMRLPFNSTVSIRNR